MPPKLPHKVDTSLLPSCYARHRGLGRIPPASESRFLWRGTPPVISICVDFWLRTNLISSISAWRAQQRGLGRVLITDSQMLTWMCRPMSVIGVKRTWRGLVGMSANDPKREAINPRAHSHYDPVL